MKPLHMLWFGFLAWFTLTISCAIPDLSNLDFSGCMDLCADESDMCTQFVLKQIGECSGDQDCYHALALGLSGCGSDLARCAADCGREVERELK